MPLNAELLSTPWSDEVTYPFVEDENANVTGYGHQDKAAFAEALNAYDIACNGEPFSEDDLHTAGDVAHLWVIDDADHERLTVVQAETPGAEPVTTVWGQR